ncbi:hypothetical protein EU519_01220 [Candidatus Thorarchaeota archaeon]|nr:MAG: hypothetical protein EU519_01220 [Candidatus Thorarchaeota archaeon]
MMFPVLQGEYVELTRNPLEIYQGLVSINLTDEIQAYIARVVNRYSDLDFADENMSAHLGRFIEIICRLISQLNHREEPTLTDLMQAVDILDFFASTTRWWNMTRSSPGLVMRPASRDPREFIRSIPSVRLGSETVSRIRGASERLLSFLDEHEVADAKTRSHLQKCMVSAWTILSVFCCKSQGRNVSSEADFESAYDILRILLFHTPRVDFAALTAIRGIATSPRLPQIADVSFSPGFEKKLESSTAARLEASHGQYLGDAGDTVPRASRAILTNSLRRLVQIESLNIGISRIEENDYDTVTMGALSLLEKVHIDPEVFLDEKAVIDLFKRLRPAEDGIGEGLALLTRKLESLIVDSTGNRNFLLQNARMVPRMIALLLLVSSGTKSPQDDGLRDIDLKRGLILLEKLISD